MTVVPFGRGISQPRLDSEVGTAYELSDGNRMFWDSGAYEEQIESSDWSVEEMQEMLRIDGKSASIEGVLTLPIRAAAAKWGILPGRGNEDHDDITEQMADDLARMETPMEEIVGQMTNAFIYRRTTMEKVYTILDDDRFGYKGIYYRPPSTTSLLKDKKGKVVGFKQITTDKPEGIKILKPYALTYVHGRHKSPAAGVSDMEVAWQCYNLKQKIKFLWYSFLEGQALPRTVIISSDIEAAKSAVKAVAQLKSAGVAGVPQQWINSIETIDSGGRGAGEFKEALRWLDAEAAGSVLAGFTDLPSRAAEGVGSFALSKDSTDFFLQMQQGNARELCQTVRTDVLADLTHWNYGQDVMVPRFVIGSLDREDATASVTLLQTLATAPDLKVPLEFIEMLTVHIAELLGLDLDKLIAAQVDLRGKLEQEAETQQMERIAAVQAQVDTVTAAAQQAKQQQQAASKTSAGQGGGQSGNGGAQQ